MLGIYHTGVFIPWLSCNVGYISPSNKEDLRWHSLICAIIFGISDNGRGLGRACYHLSSESLRLDVCRSRRHRSRRVYGGRLAGACPTHLLQSTTLLRSDPGATWPGLHLSARVQTLAPNMAMTLFLVYSALNGVIFSFILLVYTGESIATTFLVTAGMFGAMALYGSTTRAQPGRRRAILLHGIDWSHTRLDCRHVLAQRCSTVPDHRYRRDRVHGIDGVGRAAPQTDGGDGAGRARGFVRRRRCASPSI